MSKSNSPDDDQVAGSAAPTKWLAAPSSPDPAREIEAEIADHLATSAGRLQDQGVPAQVAGQQAQQAFGDPAAISRQCYWIKQGDLVMFRTAVIALLSFLCIALAITTFSGWRAQSHMAAEVSALTEQLKVLTENQRVSSAAPQPLEITGRAYVGSPDKPASNVRITIIDVKDASHVRKVGTDKGGNFNSGPLGGGDYALLAETGQRMYHERYPRLVQSAPIGVYPGVPVPKQDFNIACQIGVLSIETSRPLPKLDVDNRYTIDSRLMVKIHSSQNRPQPWIAEMDPPQAWPVYPQQDVLLANYARAADRFGAKGRIRRGEGQEHYDILQPKDLENFGQTTLGHLAAQLPAGKVEVAAAILADVYPLGYTPQPVPVFDIRQTAVTDDNRALQTAARAWQNAANSVFEGGRPVSLQSRNSAFANRYSIEDDNYFWMTKGLGHIWLTHLRGPDEENSPRHPHLITSNWLTYKPQSAIALPAGSLTRVQVAIPEDLESRIRELVDRLKSAGEFQPFALAYVPGAAPPADPSSSPFFREATISVVRTEPLKNEEVAR